MKRNSRLLKDQANKAVTVLKIQKTKTCEDKDSPIQLITDEESNMTRAEWQEAMKLPRRIRTKRNTTGS